MLVWIAMRYIFSGNYKYLQHVYYSDIEKVGVKDNESFLKDELEIIKPDFSVLFGKTSCKYEPLFNGHEVSSIYFPSGQGAMHDLQAIELTKCRDELSKWLSTS
jgi:hypothetical protein